MEVRCVGVLSILVFGRLLLFLVGFIVVVTRGWGGLLGSDILHKCSCISGSCVVAVAGEEVSQSGEFLVQVLTK